MGKKTQHGTYSSYNMGCRCGLCREAKREYGRRYRAANAERIRVAVERGEPLPENIPHGTAGGYTNFACRCEDCTAAAREDDRRYRAANRDKVNAAKAAYLSRKRSTPFEDIPHGTTVGYSTYGCRCADCRKANTARCQRYRDANREKVRAYGAKTRARLKQSENIPHGTLNAYANYGCRCDECKAVQSEYNRRRYREAKLATVTPIRQPQTEASADMAA